MSNYCIPLIVCCMLSSCQTGKGQAGEQKQDTTKAVLDTSSVRKNRNNPTEADLCADARKQRNELIEKEIFWEAEKDSLEALIKKLQPALGNKTAENVDLKDSIENMIAEGKKSPADSPYKESFKNAVKNAVNLPLRDMVYMGKKFDCYVVDLKSDKGNTFMLYNQKEGGAGIHDFNSVEEDVKKKKGRLAFAMNAGMYDADQTPVGLYIENGKTLRPLNTGKGAGNFYDLKPNGVLAVAKGKAYIVSSPEYIEKKFAEKAGAEKILWATQSGPMLLVDGVPNAGFGKTSTNTNIRNGVGITDTGKLVFAISNSPVTFYEFAMMFQEMFGAKQALYLDGVISKMYMPDGGRFEDKNHTKQIGPILVVVH